MTTSLARRLGAWTAILFITLLHGCATKEPPYDYSAFAKARPASLLVLPPLNDSPDLKATPSVWAHSTRPLAEAGYYVLPVTLVDETFKQNGISTPPEAHEIPLAKLRDHFGADAAVFLKISKYGTSYHVISSETRVDIEARILDLRTGDLLWNGKAFATSAENQQAQGGIVGILVSAIVHQIIGTATDVAFNYAGIASARLLNPVRYNGLFPGPRLTQNRTADLGTPVAPVARDSTGSAPNSSSASEAPAQRSAVPPVRAVEPAPASVTKQAEIDATALREGATSVRHSASRQPDSRAPTSAPQTSRIVQGKDGYHVERLAKQAPCSAQASANMVDSGAGFEVYEIECSAGERRTYRCEFGNCTEVRRP